HFVGTEHFKLEPSAGLRVGWYIIVLVVAAAIELNALGFVGGTGPGPTKQPLEKHRDTIVAGLIPRGIVVVLLLLLLTSRRAPPRWRRCRGRKSSGAGRVRGWIEQGARDVRSDRHAPRPVVQSRHDPGEGG